MIYGLYLSATGVLANSHRQDVIANNLANAETVGFKRDLAVFRELRTAAQLRGLDARRHSNPWLEPLGGGLGPAPAHVDYSQGELESTGDPLTAALDGRGFFAVRDGRDIRLTRDGRFTVNRSGNLALAGGGQEVLDDRLRPIPIGSSRQVTILSDGSISRGQQFVARLGVFDVADRSRLRKMGSSLLGHPLMERSLRSGDARVNQGFVERGNVDPTLELARLMDAHRQLEANANMIRFQDQTLSRLVNDVGRIG
jgi:flagellar basal-body rod protein FlgF